MGTSIDNRQRRVAIDTRTIRRMVRKILNALGYPGHEVSIVLVDDREITHLNRQYFRRNRPTNVISFPMTSGEPTFISDQVLGDVVLSAETAQRQATAAGKKTEDEIVFLLIHGILHLVGYDHEGSREERRRMEEKEEELFSLLTKASRQR